MYYIQDLADGIN